MASALFLGACTQNMTEPTPNSDLVDDQATITDTDSGSQTFTNSVTDTDSITNSQTQSETQSQTQTFSDTMSSTDTQSQTETQTDGETATQTQTKTQVDTQSQTDTQTQTQTPTETKTETEVEVNQPSVAKFTYEINDLTVSFMNQSTDPNANDTLTFHWDFGNGQTSEEISPTQDFIASSYQVSLSVNDGQVTTVFTRALVIDPPATRRIEAESFSSSTGEIATENGGTTVGYFKNDDFTVYNDIDLSQVEMVSAAYASITGTGAIEMRVDSANGELFALMQLSSTNDWQNYVEQSAAVVNQIEGVHNLYIVGKDSAGNYIANFDYFELHTSNNINVGSANTTIEEQSAGFCFVDGLVQNEHGGTGSGYSNSENRSDSTIQWSVEAMQSGVYQLTITYAGINDSRPGALSINGLGEQIVPFAPTNAWTDWQTHSINVVLFQGANTILLSSTIELGLPNIDKINIVGDGITPLPCVPVVVPDPNEPAQCGDGVAKARVTGSAGNYQMNGIDYANDYTGAIFAALGELSTNRTEQERIVIMASGDIGDARINLKSHTIFEVCGTMNAAPNSRGAITIWGSVTENISIPYLNMTGNPNFALLIADTSNLHLGQIDMRMSGGAGIRFDNRGLTTNVRIDDVYVEGTSGHALETWVIDGLTIGRIVARDTGYAGLLLNNTRNATIGLVEGYNTGNGTGYATLRFANGNGNINGQYPTNIVIDKVISRGGARGLFCVSQSGGAHIKEIDFADNGNNSILIENCYNVTIDKGTINGGGELRLSARSEFENNRDITISNVNVSNTSVRESPCGNNINFNNVNVTNGNYNVCN
ncbi:hypothetical protein TYM08_P3750 [Marinicellulosiphila megalodicopiae]